jgi:hypothetical protein
MTTPIPEYIDPNNPILATGPARLDTGTITVPQAGKLGVFTVRTPSTTVTVMLSAEDARSWADLFDEVARDLGGTKLQKATPMDVAELDKASAFKKR